MNQEKMKELLPVQNQAYKRKKIEIADGCYVTFCWPPAGD